MTKFTEREKPLFVDVDRLAPGDIILCRPREKGSKLTAWATRGPFSHAQIVVSPGLLLEATIDGSWKGVRTVLTPAFPIKLRGRQRVSIWEVKEYSYFEIFRYVSHAEPDLERLRELQDQLFELGIKHAGIPYASPRTIVELTPFLRGPIRSRVAALFASAIVPYPAFEGVFCSQLIVLLYANAGLTLAAAGDSSKVTPNELALSTSLEPVTDNVCLTLVQRDQERLRTSPWIAMYQAHSQQLLDSCLVSQRHRELREGDLRRQVTKFWKDYYKLWKDYYKQYRWAAKKVRRHASANTDIDVIFEKFIVNFEEFISVMTKRLTSDLERYPWLKKQRAVIQLQIVLNSSKSRVSRFSQRS